MGKARVAFNSRVVPEIGTERRECSQVLSAALHLPQCVPFPHSDDNGKVKEVAGGCSNPQINMPKPDAEDLGIWEGNTILIETRRGLCRDTGLHG